MKTTAFILCAVLWIAGLGQNQKQVLMPRVKKAAPAKAVVGEIKTEIAQKENTVLPVWSIIIHDKPLPMLLDAKENQALMDEMLVWYDEVKSNRIELNFAHKLLFEHQLNGIIGLVMHTEIDLAKKRYNIAQRWCDSLTRYIGMPSEICMEALKRSKKGYAACDLMLMEAWQIQQPEARLGLLQNVLDKIHQSTLWQEMAILEIHQYRRMDDVKPVEMMASDEE
ncbi:MAG: hypothetical protein N3F09_04620 [Bacteroidia bacterium]|nr:hypothetical protein [Bacteroidia bacterium]